MAIVYDLPDTPTDDTPPDPAARAAEMAQICGVFVEHFDLAWVRDIAARDPLFAEMLYAYESPVEAFLAAAGSAAILKASR